MAADELHLDWRDASGFFSINFLRRELRAQSLLVSLMYVGTGIILHCSTCKMCFYPSSNYSDEKCSISFCTSCLLNCINHNLAISWSLAFILDSMPLVLVHASYFVSFPLFKQINSNPDSLPTVFHYEERRPDTNHNRTLKCPAHHSVCAQNTNQLTRCTFNKCKLWANLVELSGLLLPYSFPTPHCSQTQETVLGLTWKGSEMKIWQCPLSRSFFFVSFISFFSTPSLTFAPLSFLPSPPLLPSVPAPLFSSCCVILILHTLLLWTMNNAWCVRNPQSHAWLPASITELASLLRRWIGEKGISHRIRSNFIVCFQHYSPNLGFLLSTYELCIWVYKGSLLMKINIVKTFINHCIVPALFSSVTIQINIYKKKCLQLLSRFKIHVCACCQLLKKNHLFVLMKFYRELL